MSSSKLKFLIILKRFYLAILYNAIFSIFSKPLYFITMQYKENIIFHQGPQRCSNALIFSPMLTGITVPNVLWEEAGKPEEEQNQQGDQLKTKREYIPKFLAQVNYLKNKLRKGQFGAEGAYRTISSIQNSLSLMSQQDLTGVTWSPVRCGGQSTMLQTCF